MSKITNQSQMKKYILDQTKVLRPGWDCRQVSQNSLDQIEGRVRNMVKQMIESHPTLGKTFKL
jgi:hypothetical protein